MKIEIKERPIPFSAPMVQAILEGRKGMTRRIIKFKKNAAEAALQKAALYGGFIDFNLGSDFMPCPYGKPGDRLYVRERHYHFGYWFMSGKTKAGNDKWEFSRFDSMGTTLFDDNKPAQFKKSRDKENPYEPEWYQRNSLFMPKDCARIWLEITDVRAERLAEISERDATSEGVWQEYLDGWWKDFKRCPQCGGTGLFDYHSLAGTSPDTDCLECDTNIKRFKHLWQSINGPGSWGQNPLVWVITFKRINP